MFFSVIETEINGIRFIDTCAWDNFLSQVRLKNETMYETELPYRKILKFTIKMKYVCRTVKLYLLCSLKSNFNIKIIITPIL